MYLSFLIIALFTYSCQNQQQVSPSPEPQVKRIIPEKKTINNKIEKKSFQREQDFEKFTRIISSSKKLIMSESFQNLISTLKNTQKKSSIFIAKTDNLPIGSPIQNLDKYDLAIETGIMKGLIESNLSVVEKLDDIRIRDYNSYTSINSPQFFYMHSINLADHDVIKTLYKANLLLEYNIMHKSNNFEELAVYFRLIDLTNMKVIGSTLTEIESVKNKSVELFKKYKALIDISPIPSDVAKKLDQASILNMDILNIKGEYSKYFQPSKDLLAIENGIVSSLLNNSKINLNEKTSGFALKFPEVYKNIVFNTNPILYEDWSEFISKTGCKQLIMYRLIRDEGLFIKIINAENNGEIIYSSLLQFEDSKDYGVIENQNFISSQIFEQFNFSLISDKKIMVVYGDKHPVEAAEYIKNRDNFNAMHLAIEDGIITGLLKGSKANTHKIYEKLKTLYLKQPWMYNQKVFNLNPLYLDNWEQLKVFDVDMILLYANLIDYTDLMIFDENYKNVAVSYRLIDLESGEVIAADEIIQKEE